MEGGFSPTADGARGGYSDDADDSRLPALPARGSASRGPEGVGPPELSPAAPSDDFFADFFAGDDAGLSSAPPPKRSASPAELFDEHQLAELPSYEVRRMRRDEMRSRGTRD